MDTVAFLEREDVKNFVGKNFEKFKATWLKGVEKNNGHGIPSGFRWNTMAFLSIFTWLAYRKMWKMYAIFLGCMSAMTIFEIYAAFKWDYAAGSNIYIGSLVVLSGLSTNLYFTEVLNFFEKNKNVPADVLADKIKKEGGVSVTYSILGTIGAIGTIFAAIQFGEMIWPPKEGI